MTDREKQIMGIAEIMLDGEIAREQGKIDCSMFDWKDCLNLGIQRLAGATALYNAGYRKMEEVTLRLDLGDRTPEEIKQIAEIFKGEIKKQVAKEILQDWYDDVVHGMGVDGYYIKEYAKKYCVEIDE